MRSPGTYEVLGVVSGMIAAMHIPPQATSIQPYQIPEIPEVIRMTRNAKASSLFDASRDCFLFARSHLAKQYTAWRLRGCSVKPRQRQARGLARYQEQGIFSFPWYELKRTLTMDYPVDPLT